jgi:hypothetical protein
VLDHAITQERPLLFVRRKRAERGGSFHVPQQAAAKALLGTPNEHLERSAEDAQFLEGDCRGPRRNFREDVTA